MQRMEAEQVVEERVADDDIEVVFIRMTSTVSVALNAENNRNFTDNNQNFRKFMVMVKVFVSSWYLSRLFLVFSAVPAVFCFVS